MVSKKNFMVWLKSLKEHDLSENEQNEEIFSIFRSLEIEIRDLNSELKKKQKAEAVK